MAVGLIAAESYGAVGIDHGERGFVVLEADLSLIVADLHQEIGISLDGGLRRFAQLVPVHHILGLDRDPKSMGVLDRGLVDRPQLGIQLMFHPDTSPSAAWVRHAFYMLLHRHKHDYYNIRRLVQSTNYEGGT